MEINTAVIFFPSILKSRSSKPNEAPPQPDGFHQSAIEPRITLLSGCHSHGGFEHPKLSVGSSVAGFSDTPERGGEAAFPKAACFM
jgi:hypothetical protein